MRHSTVEHKEGSGKDQGTLGRRIGRMFEETGNVHQTQEKGRGCYHLAKGWMLTHALSGAGTAIPRPKTVTRPLVCPTL